VIRRAGAADLDGVIAVYRASREQAHRDGLVPPIVGDAAGLRAFLERTLADHEVWVDEREGRPVAMLVLAPGWVEHLYVEPAHARQGIGTALLELAQERQDALQLWTFQANHVARRFYAAHGFTELESTDGSGNMERTPDVRLGWQRFARG
jgi:GNAT superfamily N-acetyltransferase